MKRAAQTEASFCATSLHRPIQSRSHIVELPIEPGKPAVPFLRRSFNALCLGNVPAQVPVPQSINLLAIEHELIRELAHVLLQSIAALSMAIAYAALRQIR